MHAFFAVAKLLENMFGSIWFKLVASVLKR